MRWMFLAALTMAACTGRVHAADVDLTVKYSPALAECMAKSGDTTMGMVDCQTAEEQRWDGRLNAAYHAIMASPRWSASTKDRLRDAQRAWITYSKAKCVAAGQLVAEGGTLAYVASGECAMDTTAQRAVELERALTAPP